MAGMNRSEIRALIRECEAQGVTAEPTRNGMRLLLPNGTSTHLHWTDSDRKDRLNIHARLRRAGVEIRRAYTAPKERESNTMGNLAEQYTAPDDGNLVAVTKPRASTLAKVEAVLADLGNPIEIRPTDIKAVTGQSWTTLYTCLYYLGYRRTEADGQRGYLWALPETVTHPEISAARSLPEPPVTDVTDVTAIPAPESQPKPAPRSPAQPGTREFLDTADSWTVDAAQVGTVPLSALIATYRAAGLACELRIWRDDSL